MSESVISDLTKQSNEFISFIDTNVNVDTNVNADTNVDANFDANDDVTK